MPSIAHITRGFFLCQPIYENYFPLFFRQEKFFHFAHDNVSNFLQSDESFLFYLTGLKIMLFCMYEGEVFD